jgi:uncharacterized cupin superfamily protein
MIFMELIMKKVKLLFVMVLLSITSNAGSQGISSSVYEWNNLSVIKTLSGEERIYVKSPTLKLSMFEVKAITINSGKAGEDHQIENGTDELIIIKEGVLDIMVNKDLKVSGEGSVVVASGGDKITILNNLNTRAVYYSVSFKPNPSTSQKENRTGVSPLFVDWKTLKFAPSVNGGRYNIMMQKTSTMKELEIHVTSIKEGISNKNGTGHPEEGFVLIRKGTVDVNLDGNHYKGSAGSLFFLASGCIHSISNIGSGTCEYFAVKWLTE